MLRCFDKLSNHKLNGHKLSNHKLSMHRLCNHKLSNHRLCNHKLSNHRLCNRDCQVRKKNKMANFARYQNLPFYFFLTFLNHNYLMSE